MENRHQWFMDRIGKRVYVAGWQCDCSFCKVKKSQGEIIEGEEDAGLLFSMESESEGIKYFDTPQEVLEFKQKTI